MKQYLVLVGFLFFCYCQKKQKDKENCIPNSKEYKMYQMSEMAALMEQMYVYNLQVKQKIEKGEDLETYPDFFEKIYTAKFTTPSDNDSFFKEKANDYLAAQKLVFEDKKNQKNNFNKMVDACITCHKGKCGGPIVRIKKLYIH